MQFCPNHIYVKIKMFLHDFVTKKGLGFKSLPVVDVNGVKN